MASATAGQMDAGAWPGAKPTAWNPHESRFPHTSTRSRTASPTRRTAGVSARRRRPPGVPPSGLRNRVPESVTICITTAATGSRPRKISA